MRFVLYFVFLRWFFRILLCAQQDPIETVFVAIEGDISGLLDKADEGVDETTEKMKKVGDEAEKTSKRVRDSAGRMRDEFGRFVKTTQDGAEKAKGFGAKAGFAFGLAAGAAGKLLEVVSNLAIAIPQFFINLGKQAVQANAQFETFATQFETLLGSGSLAQERLEELAQFGVETPFELPEVVEASRTLQTFGGTALATGDNLRMIGDIAAGVNQPFQDVAFWIGRMFDALQNGQPFGEASARLQEMGALTGDARRQMEQMQKAGAEGAEIFGFFSEQVGGRFAGNMERLSGTFQGVTSNLEDFRGNLLRVGGEPFFEEVRQSAIDFLDLLNQNEGTIEAIAIGIGEIGAEIIRFVREGLLSVDIAPLLENIKSFVTGIKDTIGPFIAFGEQTAKFISSLKFIGSIILTVLGGFAKFILSVTGTGLAVSKIVELVKGAGGVFAALQQALTTAAQGFAIVTAVIEGLKVTVAGAVTALGGMGKAIGALLTGNLDGLRDGLIQANDGLKQMSSGGAAAFKESMLESAAAINKRTSPAVEELTEDVKGLDKAISDAADTAEAKPLLDPDQLEKFGDQLAEAVENRAEQQAKLEQDLAEKTAEIIKNANKKQLEINQKFNDDMADLAQDSEEKRLNVIQNTRQALADLEESTDRQLSDRRKEFNKNELRQTEDHLKEMRRLQEDFLFNLDDAVRERDAGAIVDLQRQFQRESSRREEDFSTGQNRQGKDFDAGLDAIRKNEAQKREELLSAQAEELDNINKFEKEKEAELDIRRQEEQDKLGQDLTDKLNQEKKNFLERQAVLDEALQNQLESITKNLADQKDLTEEGAREILETFDKFFGIGGDIDQLMEDFARKRKIRADITVAFEGKSAPEPETETETPSSRLRAGQSAIPGRRRPGGVQEFAEGGTLIANKPTLALFGEAGPEVVQFTPMSELSSPGQSEPGRMIVELTGSAPPGIGSGERDAIAAVLLTALQDSGALQ